MLVFAELNNLKLKASQLFDWTKSEQSAEYYDAAKKFNDMAIGKLGRENAGCVLMVTK
jgi:hypothetical protein